MVKGELIFLLYLAALMTSNRTWMPFLRKKRRSNAGGRLNKVASKSRRQKKIQRAGCLTGTAKPISEEEHAQMVAKARETHRQTGEIRASEQV